MTSTYAIPEKKTTKNHAAPRNRGYSTTMKNKIEFSTAQYAFSHGKEPRGRGSWAFALNGKMNPDDLVWVPARYFTPWGPRLYSEAKKWIRENAPAGTYLAEVQP